MNECNSICGKRRQPFDDDQMVCSQTVTDSLFTKTSSFPAALNHHDTGSHAPKRLCNGVSSVHNHQPLNTAMQPYQEVPTMGGDSRLYLDSPPHNGCTDRTMETDDAMDVEPEHRHYNNNSAVYNMREMGQQLQRFTQSQVGYKASSQQRVCIRCLAGEAGHITHILDCIG